MVSALEINPTTFPAARFANINSFIQFLLPIITLIALFVLIGYMIWGAFDWIMAKGIPERLEKARKRIIFSIIGFIVIITAYALTKLIGYILHIEFFI